MGRSALKSDDVDGFVLAAHDEVRDCEQRYQVRVLTDVRWGSQRGKLSIHQAAIWVDGDGREQLVASVWVAWPSVKYTSVHAMLYNLCCRLNIALQHWYHQRTGEYYSSPVD